MVGIKWHLLPKQVEKVDLYHDSDRDGSKQIS